MGIKERIKKLIDLRSTNQSNNNGQDTEVIPKTWALSQEYEWSATTQFMSTAAFKELATEAVTNENLMISKGYAPELTLKEFFGGSEVN